MHYRFRARIGSRRCRARRAIFMIVPDRKITAPAPTVHERNHDEVERRIAEDRERLNTLNDEMARWRRILEQAPKGSTMSNGTPADHYRQRAHLARERARLLTEAAAIH